MLFLRLFSSFSSFLSCRRNFSRRHFIVGWRAICTAVSRRPHTNLQIARQFAGELDPQNPQRPIFLDDAEATLFNCDRLCGNPLRTRQACARPSDAPNAPPSCVNGTFFSTINKKNRMHSFFRLVVEATCMANFIQEWNDETENFVRLMNGENRPIGVNTLFYLKIKFKAWK